MTIIVIIVGWLLLVSMSNIKNMTPNQKAAKGVKGYTGPSLRLAEEPRVSVDK